MSAEARRAAADLPDLMRILRDNPGWLDEAVPTPEASQITGRPIASLETLRVRGGGPPFVQHRPGGKIVSALVHRGRDPQSIISLASLVDYDTAKEALSFFLERSGGKTNSQISGFTCVLQMIAEHWAHVDEPHLKRLKRLWARLRVQQTGLTLKSRERLQQFDDG